MQNWQILTLSALFSFFAGLAASLVAYLWARAKFGPLINLSNRVDNMEEWINAQIKAQEKHIIGQEAQETRQSLQEQAAQATEEGKAVLLSKGTMEEKKGALLGLIQKYPKVSMTVARRLNRQYGLSKFLGISEDEFLNQVALIATQALSAPPANESHPGPPLNG